MFLQTIDPHISLKMVSESDAKPLFQLIEKNRDSLGKWLPWAFETNSIEQEKNFIKLMRQKNVDGTVVMTTILFDNQIVGALDFHNINHESHHAEIGYWLASEYQGQGIMTKATTGLIALGFSELELHSIRILADIDNYASNNVAKRLGFQLDGTLYDYLLVNGTYRNVHIYSLVNKKR